MALLGTMWFLAGQHFIELGASRAHMGRAAGGVAAVDFLTLGDNLFFPTRKCRKMIACRLAGSFGIACLRFLSISVYPTMDLIKAMKAWSVQDSADLYNIKNWGKGILASMLRATSKCSPDKREGMASIWKKLVDELIMRGINLPVLVRFTDILKNRSGGVA